MQRDITVVEAVQSILAGVLVLADKAIGWGTGRQLPQSLKPDEQKPFHVQGFAPQGCQKR